MRTTHLDHGPARNSLLGLFTLSIGLAAGGASAQINLLKPSVVKPATGATQTQTVQLVTPKIITPTAGTGTGTTVTPVTSATAWGSYKNLFAADSPWNSRPVSPIFSTVTVPTSYYFPAIANGAYSTGVFQALTTDAPMTIYGPTTAAGIADPDSGFNRGSITVPHWPASAVGATGTDGHADIVDESTGIVHSFWQLKQISGKWTAALYSWAPLNGRGFGDPAHYYQGARAAGVPTSAGVIRLAEINDGKTTYMHALAMSLTYNALASGNTADNPAYIFPATSSDYDANQNTGTIPEGALLMLPSTYDTSKIANKDLKKIADTLKLYGAYVVDRNYGTPYVIYVENPSAATVNPPTFNLMPNGWDNTIAGQLDDIRANLRQVTGAKSWVDGNNQTTVRTSSNFNNLSMRGPWQLNGGPQLGSFDTWTQTLNFPATATTIYQSTVGGPSSVIWAKAVPGTTQLLTVKSTGGASVQFGVYSGSTPFYGSPRLTNGQTARFVWPTGGWAVMSAGSGVGAASSVTITMTQVTP
jgi:hypothetical protein